MTAPQRKCT